MKKLRFYHEGWGRRIQVELGDNKNHYIDVGAQSNKLSTVSEIDTLILSHFHDDHFRSFSCFRSSYSKFYYNSCGFTLSFVRSDLNVVNNFKSFITKVISSGVIPIECWAGSTIRIENGTNSIDFQVHYPRLRDGVDVSDYDEVISYQLDRAIRTLINVNAVYDQYLALAKEYSRVIVNLVNSDNHGDSDSLNTEDGDTPKQRVEKYIYLEMILKLLCCKKRDEELILRLLALTDIEPSKMYKEFARKTKSIFKNAHSYNMVLTTKNQTCYLPGDIDKSKVTHFKPEINFNKVNIFEMPHHGSNETKYWSSKYNDLSSDTIFIRSFAKHSSRTNYSPNIGSGPIITNNTPSSINLGEMHCTGTLPAYDDFIEVDLR